MSLKEAPFAMLQDPEPVASIDGFAMFAIRAFLSLRFWVAFSLVTSRSFFFPLELPLRSFGLPYLVLVVLVSQA